jgi:hypothetical protein
LIIFRKKEHKPTVSIMEFHDGKVIYETQDFANPFEPPAWRDQWVERMTETGKISEKQFDWNEIISKPVIRKDTRV